MSFFQRSRIQFKIWGISITDYETTTTIIMKTIMHKIGREIADFPRLIAPNKQNMPSKASRVTCPIAINLPHAAGAESLPGPGPHRGYLQRGRMSVPDAIPLSRRKFHNHVLFWQQHWLQSLESCLKRRIVIVNNKQQQQYTFRESPEALHLTSQMTRAFYF